MTAAVVTSNVILVLTLATLFIRERCSRRALEEVLRQSITHWRNAYEANLESRGPDPGLPDDRGV